MDRSKLSQIIQYLQHAQQDNELLLHYLQSRKDNVHDAWNTLRKYTENRFQNYPSVFLVDQHVTFLSIMRKGVYGVLKNRDKFGRGIVFLDSSKWNLTELSVDDLTVGAVVIAETFWREPEVLKNGIIFVQNMGGFGRTHVQQHTIYHLMRIKNIMISLYSPNQSPTELFEIASPEILPKWMGGKLSIEEAFEEVTFFEKHLR
ncbi:unnamed protein product [Orchesella dallaii]|uniref:Retinaldehyde-binding protein 1 n=1 Tax=Orchesella dallaii TaxID=48710 RepID=A0ABP1RLP4_9HEXA